MESIVVALEPIVVESGDLAAAFILIIIALALVAALLLLKGKHY